MTNEEKDQLSKLIVHRLSDVDGVIYELPEYIRIERLVEELYDEIEKIIDIKNWEIGRR